MPSPFPLFFLPVCVCIWFKRLILRRTRRREHAAACKLTTLLPKRRRFVGFGPYSRSVPDPAAFLFRGLYRVSKLRNIWILSSWKVPSLPPSRSLFDRRRAIGHKDLPAVIAFAFARKKISFGFYDGSFGTV